MADPLRAERERATRTDFGATALRRSPARRLAAGIATVLGVAAVTFLLGEIAFRVVLGIQPLSEARGIYLPHERWGWHYRPGATDDFVKLGAKQRVTTSSMALREREIPYERRPGVRRVLALGDSAVAGLEVAPEAVWTRVAERVLNEHGVAVEFVNAGVRGWGTDQSLVFLMDEGVRYRPDLVLYFWNDNDIDDNTTVHRPFREFGKAWFDIDGDGRPVLEGVPVPRYDYAANVRVGADGEATTLPLPAHVPITMWVRDHVVMTTAFGTALVHVAAGLPQLTETILGLGRYGDFKDVSKELDRSRRVFRVTAALVAEMRRVSEANGAQFRMIGAKGKWPDAILDETGIESLHDLDEFRARIPEGGRFLVPFDSHWNELGHEVYGRLLAEKLEASGLLAPPPAS